MESRHAAWQMLLLAAASSAGMAQAADATRIGEVNSYKAQAAFLEPYKDGAKSMPHDAEAKTLRATG